MKNKWQSIAFMTLTICVTICIVTMNLSTIAQTDPKSSLKNTIMTIIFNDGAKQTVKLDQPSSNIKSVTYSAPQPATGNAAMQKWVGKWETSWGVMTISIEGDKLVGSYEHQNGKLFGIVSDNGNRYIGTWGEEPTYSGDTDAGAFVFTLNSDGKSFTGSYGYGSESTDNNGWDGKKIE